MAGPEESGTGKGKGKGKSRDGGGGSAAGSAAREDITPPSRTSAGRPPTLALRLYGASGVGAAEMEAPRRRTVCLFAALVSALALARSFLLPVPSGYAGATGAGVPAHLEENLVRLVLAEQLEGVSATLRKEERSFDEMRKRRAAALKEVQGFEERLRASAEEMRELEGLGRAVHEDNSGDAGLATEVSRAQDSLRDLHRAAAAELDGFKRQLEGQAETMRGVRDGLARAEQLAGREEDRLTAAVHENLETRLEETLNELSGFYASLERAVGELSPDVITKADLEALLESAAEPSDRNGAGGATNAGGADVGGGPAAEDEIRALSEAAVDLAIKEMVASGAHKGGGEDEEKECVSEEALREEVDAAIHRLVADGTGLRDYVNAAIGGKVLTSRGFVSDTYTPKSWWAPSRYWHMAGVENGIGPVESIISEDSSLGACWAMSGSEGFVTVELPNEAGITVDGVSLEHASRMITVESSSAPREFQVMGMRSKTDAFPVKLVSGEYDIGGRPIQTFPIEPLGVKFSVIQLKILSNWGNPDFTCLYRLRVHGRENP